MLKNNPMFSLSSTIKRIPGQRPQPGRPLFFVPLLIKNIMPGFSGIHASCRRQFRCHFRILPTHLIRNHFSGRLDVIPHCPGAAPILFRQLRKGHPGAAPVKPMEIGKDPDLPEPRQFRDHTAIHRTVSIRSPISRFPPPPSIFEMIKVLTAGTKTMVTPEMIPGMLKGMITFRNTSLSLAPRS